MLPHINVVNFDFFFYSKIFFLWLSNSNFHNKDFGVTFSLRIWKDVLRGIEQLADCVFNILFKRKKNLPFIQFIIYPREKPRAHNWSFTQNRNRRRRRNLRRRSYGVVTVVRSEWRSPSWRRRIQIVNVIGLFWSFV